MGVAFDMVSKSAFEKLAQLSSSGSEAIAGAVAQGFPASNATIAAFDSIAYKKNWKLEKFMEISECVIIHLPSKLSTSIESLASSSLTVSSSSELHPGRAVDVFSLPCSR